MEERLVNQVKRIYHDTKQAIDECNFLTLDELDKLLLTPSEEESILNVTSNQSSLIRAASLLRELHARFLRTFVLSAFDLTWDMITTPKRFEYAKQKELELYNSLMDVANLKQDEIKQVIRETVDSIKEDIINSILNVDTILSSVAITSSATSTTATTTTTTSAASTTTNNSDSANLLLCSTKASQARSSEVELDQEDVDEQDDDEQDDEGQVIIRPDYCQKSIDSGCSQFTSLSCHSIENISSRSELQLHRQEIQEFVLQQLNASIAGKLVGSVESLRNSYVGTLERCLTSLEQSCSDDDEPANALLALRQILNAAYRVEVSVQSSTSLLRVLWEKMKQLLGRNIAPLWNNIYSPWNNNSYGCIIDDNWKKQQALDIIDNLSETRLAKSICSQFRARLKASHEQFLQSIRDLELQHAGRLQNTEELRLRVRKMHAPRMAKYALESTSLIDLIAYGMPCLEKEIGRGQYGVVYACQSWANYSPCAVKSVVPPDDKHWYDLAMEFYYTRCIPEHERVVSIVGSVIDHSYGTGSTPAVLLIMQRLNRDLYSAIKAGLDWLSRLQVAIDVVEGIRFLHNQGLVHRDIKLKNILLDENNRAKITDLGFCKPEAMMSGSVVGTPIHMSPELFSGRYDNSVDVYAFGILFWYICAGHVRLPHIFEQCQTRDQLWNCVRRGIRPERLVQFDNECWQLMVQCWDGDRTKRPLLGDVELKLRQIQSRYNAFNLLF